MALRERAAFAVLSRQAHRRPLGQQRAERERLAGRPIDPLAGLDRLAPVVEESLDRAVDVEVLGDRRDLAADLLERIERHAGVAAARIVGVARRLEAGPAPVEPVRAVGAVALRGLELAVEARAPVRLHLLDVGVAENALPDQLLA